MQTSDRGWGLGGAAICLTYINIVYLRNYQTASKAGMLSKELPEGVQTLIQRYVGDDPSEFAAMPEQHRQRGDFSSTSMTRMRKFSPPHL